MQAPEALSRARELLTLAGVKNVPDVRNFLHYSEIVADAAKALPRTMKEARPWLKDWALAWRRLHDTFDKLVEADPMMLYEPANRVAREFHSSDAYIRYFRAGNRTSKSQSGYAEHYFVTTGQHRWRSFTDPPNMTFIIGVNFSQYKGAVFEPKFLTGEQGNPLSPMFPIGGKWFNHYDEREKVITIACKECAELGKAGGCRHTKSRIRLFSDEGGWEVLQGAAYMLGHFDEHIREEFFSEALQRFKTVAGSCLIVTGTPLHGHEAWEHRRLTAKFLEGRPANTLDPDNPDSQTFVSMHEIDQFEAGLTPYEKIKADMGMLDEFEIESRIYGRPAPLAKNPVFDRKVLATMRDKVKEPIRGNLVLDGPLVQAKPESVVTFHDTGSGNLRVWETPQVGAVYIASVDTASGLAGRDASCCCILKATQVGLTMRLDMVAQYHGWINPHDYADEVMKLSIWYNSALAVVELTGGLGTAVVLRLREHAYWNLYRESRDHAAVEYSLDSRIGVETSKASKPFMIAALQSFIKDHRISVPCKATIGELVAYEQEIMGSGGASLQQPRYRGAGGSHDDRVMALAIAAAVAIANPQLAFAVQHAAEKEKWVDTKVSADMAAVYKELDESRRDRYL